MSVLSEQGDPHGYSFETHCLLFMRQEMNSLTRARGVVVSHPLSMREALGSIPSVSISRRR